MAVLMEEAYWANSHFSIARHYGGIRLKEGQEFSIVNKNGITLRELSDPSSKHYVGEGMAIQPGEPADLLDDRFISFYKRLGRDRFIEILKENNRMSVQGLMHVYRKAVKSLPKPEKKKPAEQASLFD